MLERVQDRIKTRFKDARGKLKGKCIMSSKYERHTYYLLHLHFKPYSSSPVNYFGQLVFAIALYVYMAETVSFQMYCGSWKYYVHSTVLLHPSKIIYRYNCYNHTRPHIKAFNFRENCLTFSKIWRHCRHFEIIIFRNIKCDTCYFINQFFSVHKIRALDNIEHTAIQVKIWCVSFVKGIIYNG